MITSVRSQSCSSRRTRQRSFTFQIRRKRFVIGNADQCLEADLFNHELTLGEELAREAFKQIGLYLLASEAEAAQVECGKVS
jgi:hypothetical protein